MPPRGHPAVEEHGERVPVRCPVAEQGEGPDAEVRQLLEAQTVGLDPRDVERVTVVGAERDPARGGIPCRRHREPGEDRMLIGAVGVHHHQVRVDAPQRRGREPPTRARAAEPRPHDLLAVLRPVRAVVRRRGRELLALRAVGLGRVDVEVALAFRAGERHAGAVGRPVAAVLQEGVGLDDAHLVVAVRFHGEQVERADPSQRAERPGRRHLRPREQHPRPLIGEARRRGDDGDGDGRGHGGGDEQGSGADRTGHGWGSSRTNGASIPRPPPPTVERRRLRPGPR